MHGAQAGTPLCLKRKNERTHLLAERFLGSLSRLGAAAAGCHGKQNASVDGNFALFALSASLS